MRRFFFVVAALSAVVVSGAASAQTAANSGAITWEVKSRFRLFRDESDFVRLAAAHRGGSILDAERRLAAATGGRGWARLLLNRLCVDAAGVTTRTCDRDGVREPYLVPSDHRVGVKFSGAPQGATCIWSFEQVERETQRVEKPCSEEAQVRVAYGAPAFATVDATRADGTAQRAQAEILVRDLLIAGLGDSIASGEGNPDRPIALDDTGFCFRRAFSTTGGEYYRPSRSGFKGNRTCETTPGSPASATSANEWFRMGAGWMSNACHRSLYSYQLRAALALAIENQHVSVTFVPLACTGAEIEKGLFASRRSREATCRGGSCPTTVPAQVPQAAAALEAARKLVPGRNFDLIFLTVGANDIYFSELVANVMVESTRERALLESGGSIASLDESRAVLTRQLPSAFAKLRAALKPMVGGRMDRVVYTSYANPALDRGGVPCGGGRAGVDIHPSFNINGDLLRQTSAYVEREFLPRIKALATCQGGTLCRDESDRMTFVDSHQDLFRDRGFCARSEQDPDFDRACFRAQGNSFHESLREGIESPLTCNASARDFRPYASRARWIRTANDSYFAAMTFPDGFPSTMQPADIHDALWGVLSAVYGGAIHPTAEGHAAMADAALTMARDVLIENGSMPAGDIQRSALPLPEGSPARE
ncbi:hypothetical protein GJW-30_1_02219 [Variibacter gotjawalensis]|uniref:SGNH hydrolase-type esterase domain-containing protein n=2 Tax=Variibacter gotjawalensis TaxID=1333996 RepID=A0A0S3PUP7_9BRAD|nr:hypothetical protein [Variibacter gotjawalensis]NIK50012.1 hypothetical protein [Variibacter gotjawalensis]RZS46011.1 hypothetical protein EV661_4337 [Variibacter gotjawalensis]BAT59686.1 hypothetical protein GJW-30_1_02219 [Variibacter gotjawalensis]